MKKTVKKALILFALIAVLAAICVFSASAINCGDGKHIIVETYHAPTCTEPGYTEYTCSMWPLCDFKGISSTTEPPLGHDFKGVKEYTYEKVEDDINGDYYKRGKFCAREDCNQMIYDTHIEDNKSVYDKYYLVKVVNPYVAEKYFADITYTNVVEKYKEELVKTKKNDQFGLWYIKKGETLESYLVSIGFQDYIDWMADVNNTNIARRMKDKAYGKYNLVGWAYEKLDADDVNMEERLIDFKTETVTANTKIYAAFKGDETVTYEVQYRSYDYEYFTTDFDVRHGQDAADDIFRPVYDDNGAFIRYENECLDREEDIRAYYEFKGWSIDRTEIYGNATILATYTAIPKEYDFVFYKWDAAEGKYVDSGVKARAAYGGQLIYVNEDGTELTDEEVKALTAREKDRSYIYSWDGNWEVLGRGLQMKSTSCSVPYDALDTRHENEDGYAPTILIPTYTRRQVLYKTYITIKFDNSVDFTGTDKEYETKTYLNNLNVQVVDEKGQLVAKGTANLVEGTDYAQLVCSLYDSQSYTVTVTSNRGKYSGTTTLLRNHVYDVDAPVHISVGLTVDEDYVSGQGCKCLCHNALFKPLWVKLLNLLYRLFNVKYVCCDDMYVSIGDLLVYTK